jgi:hypothetical protein
MTPITLLAITVLLISPASALAGHKHDRERDSDGRHEDWDRHGCVSSPENSSLLLTLLGGIGAFVIPTRRQKLARQGRGR